MRVERVGFEGFRNLEPGEIEVSEGVNVIYGDNAQGKTNLLEAIWLFSGTKSFRGAKDSELIRRGSDKATLKADFFAEGRPQTAELVLGEGRSTVLNGVKQKGASALAGKIRAVVFSPSHLSLVKDGPSERRRFLDLAIAQIWPGYIKLYYDYNRALTQRNTLLKDIRFSSQLYDMLEVYEGEVARLGARVTEYRKKYTARLSEYAPDIYGGISGGKETLCLSYRTATEDDGAEAFAAALVAARSADIAAGSTSVGPHRDDLELCINGLSARQFGSQGQQRSAVLALKLAEAAVLKAVSEEQPAALLDDVMSELDSARQDYILNHIRDWQVFITCCDAATVGMMKQGKVFRVCGGTVSEE